MKSEMEICALKNKRLFYILLFSIIIFLGGLLVNAKQITPPPHFEDLDSGSSLDAIYAVGLTSVVLFLAAGLGERILKQFRLDGWTFIERTVISLPLGLAVIGYGEFFLGLIGWIQPPHQIAFLLIIALFSFKYSVKFICEAFCNLKNFKFTWQRFSFIKKMIFTTGMMALFIAMLITLTPPFDYDGLMYHLQGPHLFLEAGKIIPIPENWFTFYPAIWEMIYMLGMGLGSDIFARLIHFSTLLLLIFSTYAFGKRFLPEPGGWISAAIMVGIPIIMVWGGFAYIDIGWSLFQFLAVVLFIVWTMNGEHKFLILSGVMQGLALSSKYMALFGVGILVLCIVWQSIFGDKKINSWTLAFKNTIFFGITSIFVAFPFYLKNYIWTGNPVFPFYIPQSVINQTELELWMDYVNSFGTADKWFEYFLLPFTIYIDFKKFGTFMGSIDMPSPLFLLVLVYPLARKGITKFRYEIDFLVVLSALQFIGWALGSQQNRFLISIFPSLSIISSAMILAILERHTKLRKYRWGRACVIGIIGGLVFASLAIIMEYYVQIKPHRVILGLESKSDFLSSVLMDYDSINFINQQLTEDDKVLAPWYGKGYYCDGRCLSDISQLKWPALIESTKDLSEINKWLKNNGITHVMLSWEDIYFFVNSHDPYKIHRKAFLCLQNDYLNNCAKKIYEDESIIIFQIKSYNKNCH